MSEMEEIIEDNERKLWEGRPRFWPFFLRRITPFIFFVVALSLQLAVVLLISAANAKNFRLIPTFFIFSIVCAVCLFVFIRDAIGYMYVRYLITNKRVILQRGIIGRYFEIVDFDKITNAEVDVGIMDKLFGGGSGSIRISTAGTVVSGRYGPVARPYVICNVAEPYRVFRFFKDISHAVKTDIHYPNAYRPKTNPGYNTKMDIKFRR